jgi:hypothetical protein
MGIFSLADVRTETMEQSAVETAYYLNSRLPIVALVAHGVRFPPGRWIRVASEMIPAALVQELVTDLFPALRARPPRMVSLLTEFDVEEFEREYRDSSVGAESTEESGLPTAGGGTHGM